MQTQIHCTGTLGRPASRSVLINWWRWHIPTKGKYDTHMWWKSSGVFITTRKDVYHRHQGVSVTGVYKNQGKKVQF